MVHQKILLNGIKGISKRLLFKYKKKWRKKYPTLTAPDYVTIHMRGVITLRNVFCVVVTSLFCTTNIYRNSYDYISKFNRSIPNEKAYILDATTRSISYL